MSRSGQNVGDEASPGWDVARQPKPVTAGDTLTPGLESGLYPQFLMLGDSITQFGADEIQLSEDELTHHVQPALQKYYVRRMDIINRGFSGYTATMGVQTIRHFLPVHHPNPGSAGPHATVPAIKLMTIFYGANDSCLPGNSQHVPVDEYLSSLTSLVNYPVLKKHNTKCILVTPPPVNEHQLNKPLTRKAWHTARYAQEARRLASRLQIPCADVWSAFIRECINTESAVGNEETNSISSPVYSPSQHPSSLLSSSSAASQKGTNDNTDQKHHIYTESDSANLPGSIDLAPNPILQSLLVDGLHLTGKGYRLLYDELIRTIEREIPECTADRMPFIFKPWTDCFDA